MLVLEKLSANELNATLPDGERLDIRSVEDAVTVAKTDVAVWNLTLVISPVEWTANRIHLASLGFHIAGTTSTGTETGIRLRKAIRTSGDGGGTYEICDEDLAVPAPILPPTATEVGAVAEFVRNHPEYKKFVPLVTGVRDDRVVTHSPEEQKIIDAAIARLQGKTPEPDPVEQRGNKAQELQGEYAVALAKRQHEVDVARAKEIIASIQPKPESEEI
jgi:hypothetical protein